MEFQNKREIFHGDFHRIPWSLYIKSQGTYLPGKSTEYFTSNLIESPC